MCMTKPSMNSNYEKAPFLLSPAGKDYLWGGRKLKDDYLKNIDMMPLAETWECSVHPDGLSVVASGVYRGKTLRELLIQYPQMLGSNPKHRYPGDLPVLVKFIDARENLSVQVHPDDAYAQKNENGENGKKELWYVVEASNGASLVYGFRHDMDPDKVKKSIHDGTIEKYLNKVEVKPDDVFYIDSGVVHAIGAGILLIEVQQNSNITYRLYDYDRIDKNGDKRKLNIDKALDVSNLNGMTIPQQPMRVLRFWNGCAIELLGRCEYFQVERLLLNTENHKNMAMVNTTDESFVILLCLKGAGIFFWANEYLPFFKGDCFFIPAGCKNIKVHGKSTFIKVSC